MSIAELIHEPQIETETVFDADDMVKRLGPESSGLVMSKDEFRAVGEWDDHSRYELIHGVVTVSPPPAEGERGPNARLDQWLWNYYDEHARAHCTTTFGVQSRGSVVFKDQMPLRRGHRRANCSNGQALDDTLPEQEIDTGGCIRRADRVIWAGLGRQPDPKRDVPTIIVEIVSRRRRDQRRDYEEKSKEYAAIGVKEYWVFDRFRRTLTVCRGDQVARVVKASEAYETPLLPGIQLDLAKLLAVADRWGEEKQS